MGPGPAVMHCRSSERDPETVMINQYHISIHRHYYRIAAKQRELYHYLDAELTEIRQRALAEDEAEHEIGSHLAEHEAKYEQREMAAVISIAFAGMCLEAFFYYYAAEQLGDSYAEHLEKLDLPSRLVVIPHLATGHPIDKSGPVYCAVKQLSKDRNYLVHFKSRRFPLNEMDNRASAFHDELNDRFRRGTLNGVKAIELVMKELDRLHGNDNYYARVCT